MSGYYIIIFCIMMCHYALICCFNTICHSGVTVCGDPVTTDYYSTVLIVSIYLHLYLYRSLLFCDWYWTWCNGQYLS